MSSGLDLGPVLDVAAAVLLSAMQTGGTMVDLSRPGQRGAVDPDTATIAAGASAPLATGIPALVVPDANSAEDKVYPGNPEAQYPRFRVILPPEHVDLRRGDEITVTASRDPRLVGSVFSVTVMLDNAAGAARTALTHRVPVSGQT